MSLQIKDILTNKEIKEAIALFAISPPGSFAKTCARSIIAPSLSRINKKTGQENNAIFLAYVVEYAISKSISK